MKPIFKILLYSIILTLLSSCNSAKYSTEFKKQKKFVKELTIYEPIVTIIAENNQIKYADSTIANGAKKVIDDLTYQVLSDKYKLNKSQTKKNHNIKALNDFYEQIDNNSNTLESVSSNQIFLGENKESRYSLLITLQGKFNPKYSPHTSLQQGYSPQSIIIIPKARPDSDLRVMIIDNKINEIVFYDKLNTSSYDPRVKKDIERITKTILKKIYYL